MNNRPGLPLVLIVRQGSFRVRLCLSNLIGMQQKHEHAVPVGGLLLTGVPFHRDGTEGAAGGQKNRHFLSSFALKSMKNRPGLSLVLIAKQVFFQTRHRSSFFFREEQERRTCRSSCRSVTGVPFCRDGKYVNTSPCGTLSHSTSKITQE